MSQSCTARPLLLVDVDGVLSLFGFAPPPPAGTPATAPPPPPGLLATAVDGIPHFVSTRAGRRLARLATTFEPVWCTGWEERAEEHLPRLLGLPRGWPHLRLASEPGAPPRHWKLAAIESATGPDRPVAWIDDAFDAGCAAWAAARRGPTLLVQTDPATGLEEAHVTRLESWARTL